MTLKGHSKSSEFHGSIQRIGFLLPPHSNYGLSCIVSYIWPDIGLTSWNLYTQSVFNTAVRGGLVGISQRCLVLDWATICRRNVKQFRCNTGAWQTDRQTDGQNCYINIARQQCCADARSIKSNKSKQICIAPCVASESIKNATRIKQHETFYIYLSGSSKEMTSSNLEDFFTQSFDFRRQVVWLSLLRLQVTRHRCLFRLGSSLGLTAFLFQPGIKTVNPHFMILNTDNGQ